MNKPYASILLGCLLLLPVSFPASAWLLSDVESAQDASNAYDAGDYAKAALLYGLLAQQGNVIAQFNLGIMYGNGKHLPKNSKESIQWYLLAAEKGYPPAQYNLGLIYARGEGVAQDFGRAAGYYRSAADQGYAPAQVNLGVMYAQGLGTLQDHVQATRWFKLAAEQGNVTAQRNLAEAYDNGLGVPPDPVQAYVWMNLAAGNARDSTAQAGYIERLADISQKLSVEQLAQASSRVASCAASGYKAC